MEVPMLLEMAPAAVPMVVPMVPILVPMVVPAAHPHGDTLRSYVGEVRDVLATVVGED